MPVEAKNGYGTVWSALGLLVLLGGIGSAVVIPIQQRVGDLRDTLREHELLGAHADASRTLARLEERQAQGEKDRASIRELIAALDESVQREMRLVTGEAASELAARLTGLQNELLREVEIVEAMRLEQIGSIKQRLELLESIALKPAFNNSNGKPPP